PRGVRWIGPYSKRIGCEIGRINQRLELAGDRQIRETYLLSRGTVSNLGYLQCVKKIGWGNQNDGKTRPRTLDCGRNLLIPQFVSHGIGGRQQFLSATWSLSKEIVVAAITNNC